MKHFTRGLHYVSIFLTVIIAASWVMFAATEINHASKESTAQIEEAGPTTTKDSTATQTTVEHKKTTPRTVIDDTANKLTSPFKPIVESAENIWVRKTVPAALGLLLYGLMLAVLARALQTRSG